MNERQGVPDAELNLSDAEKRAIQDGKIVLRCRVKFPAERCCSHFNDMYHVEEEFEKLEGSPAKRRKMPENKENVPLIEEDHEQMEGDTTKSDDEGNPSNVRNAGGPPEAIDLDGSFFANPDQSRRRRRSSRTPAPVTPFVARQPNPNPTPKSKKRRSKERAAAEKEDPYTQWANTADCTMESIDSSSDSEQVDDVMGDIKDKTKQWFLKHQLKAPSKLNLEEQRIVDMYPAGTKLTINFRIRFPHHTSDAGRANKEEEGIRKFEMHSDYVLNDEIRMVPERKYSSKNWDPTSSSRRVFSVQNIYKTSADKGIVLYVGWTSENAVPVKLDNLWHTAKRMVKLSHLRYNFWQTLEIKRQAEETAHNIRCEQEFAEESEKATTEEERERVKEERLPIWEEKDQFLLPNVEELTNSPANMFWALEDLSYWHSEALRAAKQASIFYLYAIKNKKERRSRFPKFGLVTANMISPAAAAFMKNSKYHKTIEELMSSSENVEPIEKDANNKCPSENCICDKRFALSYKIKEKPKSESDVESNKKSDEVPEVPIFRCYGNGNGLLPFNDEVLSNRRIIIECSDACGCDRKCPTRITQRGQRKELGVCYERKEKGFGVRAVKPFAVGELICEYTGEIYTNTENFANQSYQIGMNVFNQLHIEAMKFGNTARFINHSCEPNTAFFEVHSKVEESALLMPRCVVVAIKPIAIAEELTIKYYDNTEHNKSSARCLCGAPTCVKWLPQKRSNKSKKTVD